MRLREAIMAGDYEAMELSRTRTNWTTPPRVETLPLAEIERQRAQERRQRREFAARVMAQARGEDSRA